MSAHELWSAAWAGAGDLLTAREPTAAEVAAASGQLSRWYNEAHNRAMMTNETEMSPADVCAHYDDVARAGGRNFLLDADGCLMGDGDLRHIDPASGTAELAILIGERRAQGRGYGTRFSLMLHALAFERLGLERIYVTIIPANRASLRVFEKLGHRRDTSPAARAFADEVDDVSMSLGREEFLRLHGSEAADVIMSRRPA